jgi:aspartate/methionine/tyrosine aminotransferase
MSVSRLQHITRIGVEQMGDLADSLADPDVLRLENLDTNIPPPASAIAYTRDAAGDDDANSYLPFFGLDSMRQAAAALVAMENRMPDQCRGSVRHIQCTACGAGTGR